MRNLFNILSRFLKVVYVVFILLGLLFGLVVWNISNPQHYFTYSYMVYCDNGKSFDPTSKPIDTYSYSEPYSFNSTQIKSECEYGTAYLIVPASQLSKNYNLQKYDHENVVGTQSEQIKNTLIALVIYFVILELIRRTFLYIFYGKNFLTLKPVKAKNHE